MPKNQEETQMNAPEIVAMCKNIYADYVGMGREKANEDKFVLATIMYMYNNTGIDWEEVKWLWMQYLDKGILDFPTAIYIAEERMKGYEDIRATEESLLYDYYRGRGGY